MIDIYLDTADLAVMSAWRKSPLIKGFTTNPTLMKRAGVYNYEQYAKAAIEIADGLPISFEVLSDRREEVIRQAKLISSWAPNVYVKIPGTYLTEITSLLTELPIPLNITAICDPWTIDDLIFALEVIRQPMDVIISVFAGRIADTGRKASHYMAHFSTLLPKKMRLLWASTREVYNIIEAEDAGCDIITVTPELLSKREKTLGESLEDVTLRTVKQFVDDGKAAGLAL